MSDNSSTPAHLLLNRADFKKLDADVYGILTQFEKTKEWADLTNCLIKLNRILSNSSISHIPYKETICKRLAQCLNHQLPTGVHMRALEVYASILDKTTPECLSKDLALFSTGLFPFFSYSSLSVRPQFLEIIDKYYLPLGPKLLPCLIGLLICILPGLEDEKSETYDMVYKMVVKISNSVPEKYFMRSLWLILKRASKIRLPTLYVISNKLEPGVPQLPNERLDTLLPDRNELVIKSLLAATGDESMITLRELMNFMTKQFPLNCDIFSYHNKSALCRNFLKLLRKGDWSLTRRIYQWLFNTNDLSESVESIDSSYFTEHSKSVIITAVKELLKMRVTTLDEAIVPLKIIVTLISDIEVAGISEQLMPVLCIPILKYVCDGNNDPDWRHTIVRESKVIFNPSLTKPNVVFNSIIEEFNKLFLDDSYNSMRCWNDILDLSNIYLDEMKTLTLCETVLTGLFMLLDNALYKLLKLDINCQVHVVSYLLGYVSSILSRVETIINGEYNYFCFDNDINFMQETSQVMQLIEAQKSCNKRIYKYLDHFYINALTHFDNKRLLNTFEVSVLDMLNNLAVRFVTIEINLQTLPIIMTFSHSFDFTTSYETFGCPENFDKSDGYNTSRDSKENLVEQSKDKSKFSLSLSKDKRPPSKETLLKSEVRLDGWIVCLLNCCLSSEPVIFCRGIRTFIQVINLPQRKALKDYFSNSGSHLRNIVLQLWNSLDDKFTLSHSEIVLLLLQLMFSVPEAAEAAEYLMIKDLTNPDVDLKINAILRFGVLFRYLHIHAPEQLFFSDALGYILDAVEESDPKLHYYARAFLSESVGMLSKVVDPILLFLLKFDTSLLRPSSSNNTITSSSREEKESLVEQSKNKEKENKKDKENKMSGSKLLSRLSSFGSLSSFGYSPDPASLSRRESVPDSSPVELGTPKTKLLPKSQNFDKSDGYNTNTSREKTEKENKNTSRSTVGLSSELLGYDKKNLSKSKKVESESLNSSRSASESPMRQVRTNNMNEIVRKFRHLSSIVGREGQTLLDIMQRSEVPIELLKLVQGETLFNDMSTLLSDDADDMLGISNQGSDTAMTYSMDDANRLDGNDSSLVRHFLKSTFRRRQITLNSSVVDSLPTTDVRGPRVSSPYQDLFNGEINNITDTNRDSKENKDSSKEKKKEKTEKENKEKKNMVERQINGVETKKNTQSEMESDSLAFGGSKSLVSDFAQHPSFGTNNTNDTSRDSKEKENKDENNSREDKESLEEQSKKSVFPRLSDPSNTCYTDESIYNYLDLVVVVTLKYICLNVNLVKMQKMQNEEDLLRYQELILKSLGRDFTKANDLANQPSINTVTSFHRVGSFDKIGTADDLTMDDSTMLLRCTAIDFMKLFVSSIHPPSSAREVSCLISKYLLLVLYHFHLKDEHIIQTQMIYLLKVVMDRCHQESAAMSKVTSSLIEYSNALAKMPSKFKSPVNRNSDIRSPLSRNFDATPRSQSSSTNVGVNLVQKNSSGTFNLANSLSVENFEEEYVNKIITSDLLSENTNNSKHFLQEMDLFTNFTREFNPSLSYLSQVYIMNVAAIKKLQMDHLTKLSEINYFSKIIVLCIQNSARSRCLHLLQTYIDFSIYNLKYMSGPHTVKYASNFILEFCKHLNEYKEMIGTTGMFYYLRGLYFMFNHVTENYKSLMLKDPKAVHSKTDPLPEDQGWHSLFGLGGRHKKKASVETSGFPHLDVTNLLDSCIRCVLWAKHTHLNSKPTTTMNVGLDGNFGSNTAHMSNNYEGYDNRSNTNTSSKENTSRDNNSVQTQLNNNLYWRGTGRLFNNTSGAQYQKNKKTTQNAVDLSDLGYDFEGNGTFLEEPPQKNRYPCSEVNLALKVSVENITKQVSRLFRLLYTKIPYHFLKACIYLWDRSNIESTGIDWTDMNESTYNVEHYSRNETKNCILTILGSIPQVSSNVLVSYTLDMLETFCKSADYKLIPGYLILNTNVRENALSEFIYTITTSNLIRQTDVDSTYIELQRWINLIIHFPKQPSVFLWLFHTLIKYEKMTVCNYTKVLSNIGKRLFNDLMMVLIYQACGLYVTKICHWLAEKDYDTFPPVPLQVQLVNANYYATNNFTYRTSINSQFSTENTPKSSILEQNQQNLERSSSVEQTGFGTQLVQESSSVNGTMSDLRGESTVTASSLDTTNTNTTSSRESKEKEKVKTEKGNKENKNVLVNNTSVSSIVTSRAASLLGAEVFSTSSDGKECAQIVSENALSLLIFFNYEVLQLNRRTPITNVLFQTLHKSLTSYILPLLLDRQSPQQRYFTLNLIRFLPYSLYEVPMNNIKKNMLEYINSSEFFRIDKNCLKVLVEIFRQVANEDCKGATDMMSKLDLYTNPPHMNVFSNKSANLVTRVKYLNRLAFVLYACEYNAFAGNISNIIERLSETTRSLKNDTLRAKCLFVMRVLLVKTSQEKLNVLWPVLLTELIKIFRSSTSTNSELEATSTGQVTPYSESAPSEPSASQSKENEELETKTKDHTNTSSSRDNTNNTNRDSKDNTSRDSKESLVEQSKKPENSKESKEKEKVSKAESKSKTSSKSNEDSSRHSDKSSSRFRLTGRFSERSVSRMAEKASLKVAESIDFPANNMDALLVEAVKIVDIACALRLNEFLVYQWMFINDLIPSRSGTSTPIVGSSFDLELKQQRKELDKVLKTTTSGRVTPTSRSSVKFNEEEIEAEREGSNNFKPFLMIIEQMCPDKVKDELQNLVSKSKEHYKLVRGKTVISHQWDEKSVRELLNESIENELIRKISQYSQLKPININQIYKTLKRFQ